MSRGIRRNRSTASWSGRLRRAGPGGGGGGGGGVGGGRFSRQLSLADIESVSLDEIYFWFWVHFMIEL